MQDQVASSSENLCFRDTDHVVFSDDLPEIVIHDCTDLSGSDFTGGLSDDQVSKIASDILDKPNQTTRLLIRRAKTIQA